MSAAIENMMREARAVARRSQDPSTKVGGMLIDAGGTRHYGHNTFVGLADPASATREERYEDVVHAEEVVLQKAGPAARGGTYFGTHEPCGRCYRRLTLAGVRVVVHEPTDEERRERWGCASGREVALAAGVEVVEHTA